MIFRQKQRNGFNTITTVNIGTVSTPQGIFRHGFENFIPKGIAVIQIDFRKLTNSRSQQIKRCVIIKQAAHRLKQRVAAVEPRHVINDKFFFVINDDTGKKSGLSVFITNQLAFARAGHIMPLAIAGTINHVMIINFSPKKRSDIVDKILPFVLGDMFDPFFFDFITKLLG